jgi:peptidoglycan/LPS O-acetylase OafA/YrhL
MVFLHHLQFVPKDTTLGRMYDSVFYEFGSLGVGFFFVLSGFVLTMSYKKRFAENRMSYREYLVGRMARIYPLHVLTLLIAVPMSFPELTKDALSFFAQFMADLLLIKSWIPDPRYYFAFNGPSWSISAEFFFYVTFPFLIPLAQPRKIWPIAILLLVPVLILVIPEEFHRKLFYINPFFRAFDFFIGILLYDAYERGLFKPVSRISATAREIFAIGLFLAFFVCHKYIPTGFRYSCYYWLAMATIILTFSYAKGAISDMLSNKWLVLGGEISFGFYLIHQLVLRYMDFLNKKFNVLHNYNLLALVAFVIAIVASYLTYKLYEMPLNKYIKEIALRKKNRDVAEVNSAQAA